MRLLTSLADAGTFGLLSLATDGAIAPDWRLGLLCRAGGLVGGNLGAPLQPYAPETAPRLLLGSLATAVGVLYLVQAAR